MIILTWLLLQSAHARSVTVESREREIGRELVSVSDCKYYGLVGRAGGWYYVVAIAERVTRSLYLVEVTSDGWMGDRSEKVVEGSEKTASALEVSQKRFDGRSSELACDTYRRALSPKPGS